MSADDDERHRRRRIWDSAQNLLCVRLNNMGDVLMATPAMRALRNGGAGARASNRRRITLLASTAGAAVAPYIPEVDAVIRYDAPWNKSSSAHDSHVDRHFCEELAARAFDAAVIFTCYSQSPLPAALLCTLAGIPLKLAHCRENPYQLLSDWVREHEPGAGVRHEVRRQLDLVAVVGARADDERLSLQVPASVRASLAARLGPLVTVPLEKDRYIVIHAGATAPSRRYAPERFALAARTLHDRLGVPVVFTGDGHERTLVDGIVAQSASSASNLAGMLSLGELAALIGDAGLLVSNNTGPVHIAAALGTPTVDVYALTNPQHTPWNVAHAVINRDVPCRFCHKSVCPRGDNACLDVPADDVADAAERLWRAGAARRDTALACAGLV